MDKSVKDELAVLFTNHQSKNEHNKQIDMDLARKDAAFLSKFIQLRSKVYKPAFTAFAKAVEAQGVKCRIVDQEEKYLGRPEVQHAAITIAFSVDDFDHRQLTEYPHLTLSCDKYAGVTNKRTKAP